jgi:aryl-alcohol dehydrogenase-like predicted oxidoreductase
MRQRRLGTNGPMVSAIGLGTMGMAGAAGMKEMYGPVDEAEAIATIQRALELGVNFLDTAEVYGPWRNEELVGRALRGRRAQAIVATKFGMRIAKDGAVAGYDGSVANARRALEGSLRRLNVECIDLWYLHRLDRNVPIEETVGVMAEAVHAGKVRWLGLSEVGARTLRRAHAVHPITALQSEWSIWERNLEGEVLDTCRALGIGIVPYSPLGRGFLTGRAPRPAELGAGDYRRNDPRWQDEHYVQNRAIVAALERVAERHHVSAAQVALAWLLHQGPDVVPIPGTKRRAWLEANAAAADLALDATDLAELAAVPATAGPRYGERMMAAIER